MLNHLCRGHFLIRRNQLSELAGGGSPSGWAAPALALLPYPGAAAFLAGGHGRSAAGALLQKAWGGYGHLPLLGSHPLRPDPPTSPVRAAAVLSCVAREDVALAYGKRRGSAETFCPSLEPKSTEKTTQTKPAWWPPGATAWKGPRGSVPLPPTPAHSAEMGRVLPRWG